MNALRLLCVVVAIVATVHVAAARADDSTGTHAFMVAAANPHAVAAGVDILAAGGSAVDAAIAVQMVLGLVEPQSSGIGGGAFMLYFDAAERNVISFDGRETAPAAATPGLFLDRAGAKMDCRRNRLSNG